MRKTCCWMASLLASTDEQIAASSVKHDYSAIARKSAIVIVGKSAWKSYTWTQRLEVLSSNSTTAGEEEEEEDDDEKEQQQQQSSTKKFSSQSQSQNKTWGHGVEVGNNPLCYLCVDIDHAREKFARCQDFVEQRSLAYNFSSPKLADLGGSERARLPDIFANDWEWSQKGDILLDMPPERIVVELDRVKAPLAVENFVMLCTGEKGVGKSGKLLSYVGCPFHRIIGEFVAQAGDILTGTGAGGESIFGKKFKDDREGLKKKLGTRGIIAMCNTGKNTNTSQFFFSLGKATTKLSGKHVVFGHIVEGGEVLDRMEAVAGGADTDGKPVVNVVIVECGLL